MKSPHWWSNQASPADWDGLAAERQRTRGVHPRPGVVVGAAGLARSRRSRRVSWSAGGKPAGVERQVEPEWPAVHRPSPGRQVGRRPRLRSWSRVLAARSGMPGATSPPMREVEARSRLGPVDPGPTSDRWSYRNRCPSSSVTARCDAQATGKSPRSARKMTSSKPNRRPSAATRWPVSYHHSVSRSWGPSSRGQLDRLRVGQLGWAWVMAADGVDALGMGLARMGPPQPDEHDAEQPAGRQPAQARTSCLHHREPRSQPASQALAASTSSSDRAGAWWRAPGVPGPPSRRAPPRARRRCPVP